MANPAYVRTNFNNNLSSGVSTALTAGYTAGNTVLVFCNSTSATAFSGVSDDASGVYTQLVTVSYSGGRISLWAAQNVGAATHITVTQTGTILTEVLEFSAVSNNVDASATNSVSSSSISVGPTAATTRAIELVIAVFGGFGTSIAIPTTPTGYAGVGNTSSTQAIGLFYLVTSSTGTQSASSSMTNGSYTAAAIVTLTQPAANSSGRVPNVPTLTTLPTVGSL